jgi:hypothetical protein
MIKPFYYTKDIQKYSAKHLALFLGVTTVTIWRWKGRGMPFHPYKGLSKGNYYILEDVLNWMKTQPKLMELYIQVKIKIEEYE